MYSKFHSPNSSINKTILIFQFLIFLSSITSFYKEFFFLFFIHTNSTCSKFHFHVNLKKNPKIFLNISLEIPHTAYHRFPIPCQAFQHNFEKRKEGEKDKIKLLAEREILEFAPNDRLSSKDPSLREGSETIFPIRTIGVNDRRGGSGEANRFLFPCSLPHPPSCAREGEGREGGGERGVWFSRHDSGMSLSCVVEFVRILSASARAGTDPRDRPKKSLHFRGLELDQTRDGSVSFGIPLAFLD